jgi:transcriptional regulator with XRE-family HTH domain
VLLRDALGETLRDARTRQNRTLRDVSTAANVSLGYLSEVERGRKEASSELLASICDALDVELHDVLSSVSRAMQSGAGKHETAGVVKNSAATTGAARPLNPQLRIVVPYDNTRGGRGVVVG